ncbi:hypothetical protein EBR25_00790 [bacterium]|nr:hypothetical protein [bacterium]
MAPAHHVGSCRYLPGCSHYSVDHHPLL